MDVGGEVVLIQDDEKSIGNQVRKYQRPDGVLDIKDLGPHHVGGHHASIKQHGKEHKHGPEPCPLVVTP